MRRWLVKVVPSKEKFVELAATSNVVPVCYELICDDLTPVMAYQRVAGPNTFLLESASGGENWGRYSIVGISCRGTYTFEDGVASASWLGKSEQNASWKTDNPLVGLAEVLEAFSPAESKELPRFWGGAVGWIAYDSVRYFEPSVGNSRSDLPDVHMLLTDVVAIFDNLRQRVKVVSAAYVPRHSTAGASYDEAVTRIEQAVEKMTTPGKPLGRLEISTHAALSPQWNMSDQAFCDAVKAAQEYIASGDIFQVVLSRKGVVSQDETDPFDIYRSLRTINPSPYMFFIQSDYGAVIGASPETLVRFDGEEVFVRPIAGTRRRGGSEAADQKLEEELLADEKERAEHLMLVDLGRNDVGRVCRPASVEVTKFMSVERYSHVMHIVSDVRGSIADGFTWKDVIASTLPAGTLSGAPKVRAMQIVEELEAAPRGLYGGAVGYIGFSGNADVAIAIRSAVVRDGEISFQSGAGIVADSNAERELEETIEKSAAICAAIEMARTSK